MWSPEHNTTPVKLLLVIPTFNEERHIRKLVEQAKRHVPDVLVIDDGSQDDTARQAALAGAVVRSMGSNMGKGEALKAGFAWAIDHACDFVLTMDGDGQHDPDDIPNFLPLLGKYHLILGDRMGDTLRVPLLRRLANQSASLIVSFLCFQRIRDSQTGFRAYDIDLLRRIPLRSSRYDLESEVILKAARRGFHIGHCHIQTIYEDEVSRFRNFKDAARFLVTMAKYSLWW
jgi:glycosyltransferase involved in cell wall biosynthesis